MKISVGRQNKKVKEKGKKEKRHIADGVKKQENNTGIFAVNIDSHAYADVQSDCNVLEYADVL